MTYLNGVLCSSNRPLYFSIAGPVAMEFAKQPGMKLSGTWVKASTHSKAESRQVSVARRQAYIKGLATGSSAVSVK